MKNASKIIQEGRADRLETQIGKSFRQKSGFDWKIERPKREGLKR